MKSQSPEKVSINSHEVTCTHDTSFSIQNCPSMLNNNNSNLHEVRITNLWIIVFGQRNRNLFRNKFTQLFYIVNDDTDMLMVSLTKLGDKFPTSQFFMQGYSTLLESTKPQKERAYFCT